MLSVVLLQPFFLVLLVPGFVVSFLGHEIAHKFIAQRNGLWAEFRTSMYGIMLTAISVILPFKFLAPGQVIVQGNGSRQVMGAIGLVGPGFNLVLGAGFFIFAKFSTSFTQLSLSWAYNLQRLVGNHKPDTIRFVRWNEHLQLGQDDMGYFTDSRNTAACSRILS